MRIAPTETHLVGNWLEDSGTLLSDPVTLRIQQLVQEHLEEIARDDSGWYVLYRDPDDGRLWELLYPKSEMQGGGPPELRHVPENHAADRYRFNRS